MQAPHNHSGASSYRPVTTAPPPRWIGQAPPPRPATEAAMRWTRIVLPLAALLLGLPVAASADDTPVRSYYAPPFADECTVHRFGEGETPDLTAYPDDPL